MVRPIAWRFASNWSCIRCGRCCKLLVPVKLGEALFYQKEFGNVIEYFNKGFHLKKREDDYCVFLEWVKGKASCSIHHYKPKACTLYPFYIHKKPLYGESEMSRFKLYDEEYYVYVDAECPGINRGYRPISSDVVNAILSWLGKARSVSEDLIRVSLKAC